MSFLYTQLIELIIAGIFFLSVISLSKFLWTKLVAKKQKEKPTKLQQLIGYVITYTLFMVIYSIVSSLASQYTEQLTQWNSISYFVFFLLISHDIYAFTRNQIIGVLSVIVSYAIWKFNALTLIRGAVRNLEQYSFKLGAIQLTPLAILKSLIIILCFLWVISAVSHQVKKQIKKIKTIRSNTKEILYKAFDIIIYLASSLVLLNVLGINLSSLAFIGGALGVGIGFGLQKITSNFISGLILIFEDSIEIDDLVEMDGGIYGFVRRLGSRCTVIETFDGREVLIPNEDFITNRVTNWTYSNKSGRVEITVGVSYKSDIKLAHKLILEAANEYPACLKDPEPKCFLREFGDSSVNFLLFFFISDVTTGRFEPQSEVMFSIWEKLKENNIEIPFPQRDVHIKKED